MFMHKFFCSKQLAFILSSIGLLCLASCGLKTAPFSKHPELRPYLPFEEPDWIPRPEREIPATPEKKLPDAPKTA